MNTPAKPAPGPPRKKAGHAPGRRKLALDDALIAKIAESFAAGCFPGVAAERAGISLATLRRWLRIGRTGANDQCAPHRALFQAVQKARADAELRNVLAVQEAASKHWQAAAWWLERRYPRRWKRIHARSQNPPRDPPGAPTDDDARAALVSAQAAPGAEPALLDADALQDRPRGETQREDGAGQAEAGDVAGRGPG